MQRQAEAAGTEKAAAAQARGIVAMMISALLLMLGDSISKFLLETYPIGQVIAIRQFAALAVILAWALSVGGPQVLRIVSWRGQLMRGGLFLAGTFVILTALHLLPLATVTAITFASPIFVAALSAPVLGEKVARRVWIAIIVGFVGVLVMIRPGAASFEWALLLPVIGAAVNGLRDLASRRLSRTDHSLSILFWSTLIVGVGGALMTPFSWLPVGAGAFAWFVLAGVINAGAHFAMIEGLRLGRAAVVTPFKYTGLIWAVLLGVLLWNEWPDRWLLLGALIVIGAGIYMSRVPPAAR
ncbi:MAG: DMT family transporter [Betaproteobacteria bacterium]|jgi:drug/metabolite transporter (DMT)-like permease|nr:DMT family transporter [Betaproteobacteria bacterium]